MKTAYYDAQVEEIVQSIFMAMLNTEIARITPPLDPEEASLVTSIQITGAWVGSVVLGLCSSASRAFTAAMLQMPPDDTSDGDQQDVAAELVNMIGGNFKSVLPGPSSLSLPTVVIGREFDVRILGSELLDDYWFASEFGQLRIRIFAKVD